MSIANIYYKYLYKITYKLWMFLSCFSRTYGLALMYHHVTDEDVDTIDVCKCTVDVFEKTLISMMEDGYRFVSVDEGLKCIKQRIKTKFAIVTFDDVPDNMYHNAYPILKRLEIPFVLFVTTDYIDRPGFLTLEQLKEMDSDSLCTIGGHTKSHPMLRHVHDSWSEMECSKKILERMFDHPIEFMAYPYGLQTAVSIKVIRQAEKIGYKCAFGTIQTPISDYSRFFSYYLPRVVRN